MLGFRVWHVKNKAMVNLDDLQKVFEDETEVALNPFCLNHKGELCHISAAYYLGNIEKVDNSAYIPMQSTGLKDNKGIEIFEKDILFYDPEEPPYIVVDIQLFYKDYYWGCLADNPSKIFIAGNVYENGSLIEGMFDAGIMKEMEIVKNEENKENINI